MVLAGLGSGAPWCVWQDTEAEGSEDAMIPAGQVPIGTLVFLECGCSGIRFGREEGEIVVVVERACADHARDGRPFTLSLGAWELVSPLTPPRLLKPCR